MRGSFSLTPKTTKAMSMEYYLHELENDCDVREIDFNVTVRVYKDEDDEDGEERKLEITLELETWQDEDDNRPCYDSDTAYSLIMDELRTEFKNFYDFELVDYEEA